MKKVNHKELADIISIAYNKPTSKGKSSVVVLGHFGIGKSGSIFTEARHIASLQNKTFVNWFSLDDKKKQLVFASPEKYFVFIDIRLSEYDSSDIKGLPDFSSNIVPGAIVWKEPIWARFMQDPLSDGILLFDELNLASPNVISSAYKILYDRVINETIISHNWLIIGAGNLDDDKAYTHDLAAPLRDRCMEVELVSPDINSWSKWAIDNLIDGRIIAYLNWKPSSLHFVDFSQTQKFTTERGWERLSYLIRDINDYNIIELVASATISEGIAKEFTAFTKIKDIVKLDDIVRDPNLLKPLTNDIGIFYFIMSGLAEGYKLGKYSFEQLFVVCESLDRLNKTEFIVFLWTLASRYNKKQFREDFLYKLVDHPLRAKFFKFLKQE